LAAISVSSVPSAEGNENRLQWRWWSSFREHLNKRALAYPGLRGPTQLYNASVALAALEALGVTKLPVTMQAIRPGLIETELAGRFQVVPGKPAIVLDVGHNPQAIGVLADNLSSMGFFDRTYAVVGMLNDKDIEGALTAPEGQGRLLACGYAGRHTRHRFGGFWRERHRLLGATRWRGRLP
jgi:dihydrofolate synthase/folylpolyglutamate synthase